MKYPGNEFENRLVFSRRWNVYFHWKLISVAAP